MGKVNVSVDEKNSDDLNYGLYEIRVCDNGIGMSKEFADKMFLPFERERTSTVSGIEGTGLGLSITKSIIDLMNGTIEVISSPGCGTEIILQIRFELAEEKEVIKEDKKTCESTENIEFTNKKLLLVEDNMINMEIAKMILTQAGFDVDTAENGKIAVEKISVSEPGGYSAILMDVQMPVMDGYTAAQNLRALENKDLAEIPIIAMTANAFKEDADAAIEAGMQAHISKPIDVDILLKTITMVLSNKNKKR